MSEKKELCKNCELLGGETEEIEVSSFVFNQMRSFPGRTKYICYGSAGEDVSNIDDNECPHVLETFKTLGLYDMCITCECLEIHTTDELSCQVHNCEFYKF